MTMGKAVGLKTALFSPVHGAESWRSYQYLMRSTSLQIPTRRELVRCEEVRLASDFFNSDKFSCYPPSIHDAHQLPDPGLDPLKIIQNLSLDPDCQIVIRANPTQVGIHGTFPW